MSRYKTFIAMGILSAAFQLLCAEDYEVITLAGVAPGSADGLGQIARFNRPTGVAVDHSDNIYVSDSGNFTIRKITSTGLVSTVAGSVGHTGSTNGAGSAARFGYPNALAVGAGGVVYVADQMLNVVRKIASDGLVSNWVSINLPSGIAINSAGDVFVSSASGNQIYRVTPAGVVSLFAGSASGESGTTNGTGTNARFYWPAGLAIDSSDNIYVAETSNYSIRKITPGGVVTTLAGMPGTSGRMDGTGSDARFGNLYGLAIDSNGNLYASDGKAVRKITPTAVVSTWAGSELPGSIDGDGNAARFDWPQGIAVDSTGNVFVGDTNLSVIKKISSSRQVTTFAGLASPGNTNATGADARFYGPSDTAVDSSGAVYVVDAFNNSVRKVTPAGAVTLFAGYVGAYSTGEPGATIEDIFVPARAAFDPVGNLVVTSTGRNIVVRISPAGTVTTVAGSNVAGSTDGAASVASFNSPTGVAVSNSGVIYVSDPSSSTIRKIATDGTVATLAGSVGVFGYTNGTGNAATFNLPKGMAVDATGNVYVADTQNHAIRKVTPAGVVSTYVDVGIFSEPTDIAVDTAGNLFVTDASNAVIKKVAPTGGVTAVAGVAGETGAIDGLGTQARFNSPTGLSIDANGTLYVADYGNNTLRMVVPITVPQFQQQPQGKTVYSGSAVTLGVAATGGALRYQWRLNGVPISGATSASLTLPNAQTANDGNYTVSVSNALGETVSTAARLTVKTPVLPVFITQPQSQAISLLQSVTFSASASGDPLPTYQWQKNGAAITGATSSTLTLTNLSAGDAGNFVVVATNLAGSVSSSTAVLTIKTLPSITAQPVDRSTTPDLAVVFDLVASSYPNPSYQWQRKPSGSSAWADLSSTGGFSGATTTALTISAPTRSMNGDQFRCVVSNEVGVVTTAVATLTVNETAFPPTISNHPTSRSIVANGATTFTVSADGNPTPTYQWQFSTDGGVNWANVRVDEFHSEVASATLHIDGVSVGLNGYRYRCIVTNSIGTAVSNSATLTIIAVEPPSAVSSRLVNIAVRGNCSSGDRVMIGGFVVSGSVSKRVLVRAVGPTLVSQGLGAGEVLTDPVIEVHQGVPVIASNDNWGDNANASEITATAAQIGANTLAASDTKSSALLLTLQPGVYSFIASGKGDVSGIVLLEVYDADSTTAGSSFVNIATRAYDTTGNGVTIGGFVISGNAPKQVLLRGVGPTLTKQGIGQADVLVDPTIELHDAIHGNATIATNDNWGDNANASLIGTTAARIGATPFDASDTKSAALLLTLQPGVYSFIASGKSATSGIVLVEVYDAD